MRLKSKTKRQISMATNSLLVERRENPNMYSVDNLVKNVVLRGGKKDTSTHLNPLNATSVQEEVQVL